MVFARVRMCDLCAENPAIYAEPKKDGGLARYCKSCWDVEKQHIEGRIKVEFDYMATARAALEKAMKDEENKK